MTVCSLDLGKAFSADSFASNTTSHSLTSFSAAKHELLLDGTGSLTLHYPTHLAHPPPYPPHLHIQHNEHRQRLYRSLRYFSLPRTLHGLLTTNMKGLMSCVYVCVGLVNMVSMAAWYVRTLRATRLFSDRSVLANIVWHDTVRQGTSLFYRVTGGEMIC